jgi:hypothetical protein
VSAIAAALLCPVGAYLLGGIVGIPFMGLAWRQHRHEPVRRGLDQIDTISPVQEES